MKLRHLSALLLSAAVSSAAFAKLPPPTPQERAKAEELKARGAWEAKVGAHQLCKVQDRISAKFGGKSTVAVPAGAVQPTATSSAAPPGAAAQPAQAAGAAASGAPSAPAASASGTPVAAAPVPPCLDPGPFAYTPAPDKPLESSGAHSPAGNAATPPSVRPESAEMKPGQPAAAPGNKS